MPFGPQVNLLELLDERARLEAEIGAVKGRLAQVNKTIRETVKPAMTAAFEREGQPSGTVKFMIGNHVFKAVVTKRVDWDSGALIDIARTMPLEEARLLFKISYSMSEAAFKAVLNPTLRAKLTVARTVKYDEAKVTLAEKEDA